jgi:hypothetical protein
MLTDQGLWRNQDQCVIPTKIIGTWYFKYQNKLSWWKEIRYEASTFFHHFLRRRQSTTCIYIPQKSTHLCCSLEEGQLSNLKYANYEVADSDIINKRKAHTWLIEHKLLEYLLSA